MSAEGLPIQVACRVLAVSQSGDHAWRTRPPSTRAVRHAVLTDLIVEIHAASRGVYGARRVRAELTLGRGVQVGPWRGGAADATRPPLGRDRQTEVPQDRQRGHRVGPGRTQLRSLGT